MFIPIVILIFIFFAITLKREDTAQIFVNEIKNHSGISLSKLFLEKFPGEKIIKIAKQKGGYANLIFTIRSSRQDYILRLLTDRCQKAIFKDLYLSQFMAEKGLSPKVYYVNYSQGMLIIDKIKDRSIFFGIAEKENMPLMLADMLKNLHLVKPQGKYVPKNIMATIDHQLRGLKFSGKFQTLIDDISQALPLIAEELNKDMQKRTSFIHADLSPFNILFDGKKIWVIDWETAGYGDPLYDVATIMSLMLLKPNERQDFLNRYFDRDPTKEEKRVIYLNMVACLICYGTFCLNLAGKALVEQIKPMSPTYSFDEIKKAVSNIDQSQMQLQIANIFLTEAKRLLHLLHDHQN